MVYSDDEDDREQRLNDLRVKYPSKFAPEEEVFGRISRGDKVFIGTGCGQPQYLIRALMDYIEKHPKAFFDTEVFQVWTLGIAPYTDERFKSNFRHNSFFIGNNTREAINSGLADYTPIFLSEIPDLISRGHEHMDVALIQTSRPDPHGYLSLGISVDIVKAAVENADLVIAQVNKFMPRTHGNTFIHVDNVDYIIPYYEPLLQYEPTLSDNIANSIGNYVSRLVEDGDTIQVGYGSIPNAILSNLSGKKDLGVHTELLTDGVIELMKKGVVNNSKKTLHRGKSIASFCMGTAPTYEYIDDNPSVEFRPIDYTNNPMIIAQNRKMTAINSVLQIDLTGQASAESIGTMFYSGIGGQADFMRGAVFSPGGKTILVLRSAAQNEKVSRIVPYLPTGSGVTLNRGDIHYVVTEYGIAHIHGKNIRERAMDLIAISHPKFRKELIEEAKRLGLIFKDQAFIPGKRGEYPEHLETYRTTQDGTSLLLRPVKISDEPLLKDFFYSLSDKSIYRRFISQRKDMPHERLQEFVIIDHTKEKVILAVTDAGEGEVVLGVSQYGIDEFTHTAEVAFVVRDDHQAKGIGMEMLKYLTTLAKKEGLLGFTAEVLMENQPMLHLFERMGFDIQKKRGEGVYELKMAFRGI